MQTNFENLPIRFFIKNFQRYFDEFAIFGGYPRVALEIDYEKKISYLTDIYNSYVRKDVKDLLRIDNITAFNRLIKILALQISSLVNNSELAINLQISRITLERYLFLLENTFIIKLLPPYFSNKRKKIVKMSKLLFLDNGLRNVAIQNFDSLEYRVDKDHLIENMVFSNLRKNAPTLEEIHFWHTKQEMKSISFLKRMNLLPSR